MFWNKTLAWIMVKEGFTLWLHQISLMHWCCFHWSFAPLTPDHWDGCPWGLYKKVYGTIAPPWATPFSVHVSLLCVQGRKLYQLRRFKEILKIFFLMKHSLFYCKTVYVLGIREGIYYRSKFLCFVKGTGEIDVSFRMVATL